MYVIKKRRDFFFCLSLGVIIMYNFKIKRRNNKDEYLIY